jgi:hypothetical protein
MSWKNINNRNRHWFNSLSIISKNKSNDGIIIDMDSPNWLLATSLLHPPKPQGKHIKYNLMCFGTQPKKGSIAHGRQRGERTPTWLDWKK